MQAEAGEHRGVRADGPESKPQHCGVTSTIREAGHARESLVCRLHLSQRSWAMLFRPYEYRR
jgi:hypothetical protein